jgi:ribonuclease P protein component
VALPVKNRLSKEQDFKRTLKTGRTVRGLFLFIKYVVNQGSPARFAVSVSLKVSKKAVTRNRIRRVLSEFIRHSILPKTLGYDTVVVVTKDCSDHQVLQQELVSVFSKAGIL